MEIVQLVRHGESEVNCGLIQYGSIGDHKVPLSEKGHQQAVEAGKKLSLHCNHIVYHSPYLRAVQTMNGLLEGTGHGCPEIRKKAGIRLLEDPRLREVDHGYDNVESQAEMRKEHGWFYYRFKGGESPADGFDRCCTFLESMSRQFERVKQRGAIDLDPGILIVTHGLTLRCFVMRFMHLSVEQFENIDNPRNCDIITIRPHTCMDSPQFKCGRWGVEGLRFRN